MERASRGLRVTRRSAGADVQAQWAALASVPAPRAFHSNDARPAQMNWDLVVRQLAGEKVKLAATEGRQVIRVGLGHYNKGQQEKSEVREAIVEILTDFGAMTTVQLHEELVMQGHAVGYEAMYGVLKKMTRRNLLKMERQARADNSFASSGRMSLVCNQALRASALATFLGYAAILGRLRFSSPEDWDDIESDSQS